MDQAKVLRPTVEITMGRGKRTTGWGWVCSCGDSKRPELRQRTVVLQEAREHFDTKHGGQH